MTWSMNYQAPAAQVRDLVERHPLLGGTDDSQLVAAKSVILATIEGMNPDDGAVHVRVTASGHRSLSDGKVVSCKLDIAVDAVLRTGTAMGG